MTETVVNFFIDLFNGLNKNILVFIVSMLPIVELRGGLIAASILKIEFFKAFIICFIGNILPVPFILLLIEKIFGEVFWDYSSHRFHIGHYISLEMTLVWGFSSVVFIYFINPLLEGIIKKIPPFITIIFVVLFLFDCIKTFIDKRKS